LPTVKKRLKHLAAEAPEQENHHVNTRFCRLASADNSALGVYNHSDSYPTAWRDVFATQKRWIASLIAELLQYAIGANWAPAYLPVLRQENRQPHSISAELWRTAYASTVVGKLCRMRKQQSKDKPELWTQYEQEIAMLDQIEANRKQTAIPPEAKYTNMATILPINSIRSDPLSWNGLFARPVRN